MHHGICAPLFSLYTRNSSGIGEILDLEPLIDWLPEVGMDTLQLLPLNDTGNDNSPYFALSSTAINPIYLSLHALPYLDEAPQLRLMQAGLREIPPYIDYKTVRQKKEFWLQQYLQHFGERLKTDPDYLLFIKENPWVNTYAQNEQGKLVQFLLAQQLKRVKRHAESKGVQLLGDIPILVASHSFDVKKFPELFDPHSTVGAPPDQFSSEGQSWGFPYFLWEGHEEKAFHLWRRRLEVAENYFHLYRLDHIVGFFRLWRIPEGKKAKEGHYVPESEQQAVERGRTILERLKTFSTMQPIAEDLGVVLPEFREVLKSLGIPGMKVMRWERNWHGDGSYIPVESYPPLSLTCVSTHDTETLEQWWNTHPDESKLYCRLKGLTYRPLDHDLRLGYLKDAHHSGSNYHVNLLHEYLALYPELVHDKSYEERINVPGTMPENNWRYRMRQPLEKTLVHPGLKSSIRSLLA